MKVEYPGQPCNSAEAPSERGCWFGDTTEADEFEGVNYPCLMCRFEQMARVLWWFGLVNCTDDTWPVKFY